MMFSGESNILQKPGFETSQFKMMFIRGLSIFGGVA